MSIYEFELDISAFVEELEEYLTEAGYIELAEDFLALYGKSFDNLVSSLELALKLIGSKDTVLEVSFTVEKNRLIELEIDDFLSVELSKFSDALTQDEALDLIKKEQDN